MFLSQRLFDVLLSAKDESRDLSISAKQAEIVRLDAQIADLKEELRYEKKRADTLVDRLLAKEAHVAAVAPVAEHVVKHKDAETVKKLSAIFDEINSMSGDVPPPDARAFEMAGGKAVGGVA